ncbi:MAG TPA: XdhC/CoxI family protein [Chitinophagaceae bacterium]|nr:XdhC/CoxI family protein [Chitinophagaceae bacterium]
MTKEIISILKAFKTAQQEGRQTALATIVHVEGSSYRMPGARMLVEDNGKMTGAISGGCLEGDALKKALLAMHERRNKLVTYNTLDDDVNFGVQLGCNGIVHILFEPIDPNQVNNPIALLEKFYRQRKNSVVVTLFSLNNIPGPQPGTCFFLNEEISANKIEDDNFATIIKEDAMEVLRHQSSLLKQYTEHELTAFIELLQPPVSLIIVGAGNDALPLVDMATILGWQITIIDGRATHANKQRFSKAHQIIVGKPAEVITQVVPDEKTVFVLMTHNYNYDLAMIKLLLPLKSRYIGTLGPKKKLERMLTELQEEGISITDEQKATIYGPTGLDIGAETPEEIALSIVAEIKTVLTGYQGGFLRSRPSAIHSRPAQIADEPQNIFHNTA